jgi:hypothetical protein
VRSPIDALLLTLLLAAGCSATAIATQATGAAAVSALPVRGAAITADEIRAAADRLRMDPDLGGTHKIRSLRWTQPRAPDQPQNPPAWIVGLFDYLGQTASVLLWVAGAIASALAVLWAYRIYKARSPRPVSAAAPVVTRIGDMDISPDSLPADIGAAALALAEAGKTRDALSLLYRGALSRAVHRFGVAIGESYTEGEALRAAGLRLDAARLSYFADLVGIWRRAVYAGEALSNDPVRHLCRGFAALDAAAP